MGRTLRADRRLPAFCRMALVAALSVSLSSSWVLAGRDPASWWPNDASPPWFTAPESSDPSEARVLRLKSAAFVPGRDDAELRASLPASLTGRPIDDGGLLIVQFAAEVSADRKRRVIESIGGMALDPLSNESYLALVPATRVDRLKGQAEVGWIGRFHPAFKLSPQLGKAQQERWEFATLSPEGSFRFRLRTVPGTSREELNALAGDLGLKLIEAWADGAVVEATKMRATIGIAQSEHVLYIEDDPWVHTFNDSSRGICQSSEPGFDSIHGRGLLGQDQIVTLMDSGVDTDHCCFDGASKIVDYRAWGGGVLGSICSNDHGTHTAGTAVCDNGGDHDGLAPGAALIMQDIQGQGFSACTLGSVSPPNPLSAAWNDSRNRGSRIHSNSWGGGGNSYGSNARSIDDYMWKNQDFLIIYAAGNGGSGSRSLGSYSNAKNSLTIGGTKNGSPFESMYGSSSRGPAGDGRMLPDLTAPAQGVASSKNSSSPSCGWVTLSGTSMAAPAVAGSAALVREYLQRGYYPGGAASAANGFAPTAALVKALLLISTRNMTGSGTRGPRPNSDQGFGRMTVDDVLWFDDETPKERLWILDDRSASSGFVDSGSEDTFSLNLTGASAFKVMLVWTDAPGSTSASKAIVNDLDLIVRLADGTTYRGNQGFDAGWTRNPSTARDDLNNKEAVFLESVTPQQISVTVRAEAINDVALHPQDYALVVVGSVDPTCEEPPAAGVGNSATLDKSGGELTSTWNDAAGANHYVVYRGETPDFMSGNPDPWADQVQDEDSTTAGVQWTDTGALATSAHYFYLFNAANLCGEQSP